MYPENPGHPPTSLAPHIPADLYRQAEREGRPIIIVRTVTTERPAHAYLVPLGITLAAAIGVAGTAAVIVAVFEFATHVATLIATAAGPIGVGITLRLARSKK